MSNESLTNEIERLRQERNASICRDWEIEAPAAVRGGAAPSRVMAVLASRYNMTAQGVENVLRLAGLYDGARKYKESVIAADAAAKTERP